MKCLALSALMLAALSLSSCAPQVQQAQTLQPVPASDGTALRLVSGETFQSVTLQNGSRPATSAAVRLIGGPLRVNDKRCTPSTVDLVCTLGEMPAGTQRTIYATGVMQARATVGRADGSADHLSAP